MKYVVVGDIHGQRNKLEALLSDPQVVGRKLIFVGDYIDRGPDSMAVIDRLIDMRSKYGENVVFLRGNHEELLLRWLDGSSRGTYLAAGGLSTVRSYTSDRSAGVLERFRRSFPADHRAFLESTNIYFEDSSMLVSHAGFDPASPEVRDMETMVFGRRAIALTSDNARAALGAGGKVALFGHYVQRSMEPRIDPPLYCLDTGCGTIESGRLTVMLMPERIAVQY